MSATKEDRRNKIFERIFRKFNEEISKFSQLVEGHATEAKEYFSKALNTIFMLEPDNLIFSFTQSKSLYFRLYKDNFRAHIEIFFDYDKSADDVELVGTVYSFDHQILNVADTMEKGFKDIKEAIAPTILQIELTAATEDFPELA